MVDSIISFTDKAKAKGVKLKKPPAKMKLQRKKLVELESEDMDFFQFQTDKDTLTLKILKSSDFLVFEFRDKETNSLYQTFEIDTQDFFMMNLALHNAIEIQNHDRDSREPD